MIKNKIKVEDLKPGFIFYIDEIPSYETNADQFGEDVKTTGCDVILIVDELEPKEDYIGIFTNGGYFFEFDRGTEVFYMGTYNDLMNESENLNSLTIKEPENPQI